VRACTRSRSPGCTGSVPHPRFQFTWPSCPLLRPLQTRNTRWLTHTDAFRLRLPGSELARFLCRKSPGHCSAHYRNLTRIDSRKKGNNSGRFRSVHALLTVGVGVANRVARGLCLGGCAAATTFVRKCPVVVVAEILSGRGVTQRLGRDSIFQPWTPAACFCPCLCTVVPILIFSKTQSCLILVMLEVSWRGAGVR